MKLRQMGRTGLYLSEVGLGCMTFGAQRKDGFFDAIQSSQTDADAILGRALEAGINFLDTADIYGDGASEEFLGRAIKGRRRELVIATKAGGPMGTGPNRKGSSRRYLMSACEDSLRRLGTDHIDLYQLHWPDPVTTIEETMRALDDLVRSGKVRYIGASNYGAYQLTKSLWASDRLGLARFDCLQAQYNLLTRDIEDEILPMCQAEGVGLVVWSPLASGFLSGKYQRGQAPPPGSRLEAWKDVFGRHNTEGKWETVRAVLELATKLHRSPSEVALAWATAQRGVSSVIIGARTVQQLAENLGALDLVLTSEDMTMLNAPSEPAWRYPMGRLRRPD